MAKKPGREVLNVHNSLLQHCATCIVKRKKSFVYFWDIIVKAVLQLMKEIHFQVKSSCNRSSCSCFSNINFFMKVCEEMKCEWVKSSKPVRNNHAFFKWKRCQNLLSSFTWLPLCFFPNSFLHKSPQTPNDLYQSSPPKYQIYCELKPLWGRNIAGPYIR